MTVVIDVFKWLSKLRSTEASMNIDGIPDQVTRGSKFIQEWH